MIWQREFMKRFLRYALLKFVGTTTFISIFFIGYFHVLRHTTYEVTLMPLTALDRMIGFHPSALIAYVSLWVYVGIPPALFYSLRELVAYGCWIAGLCIAGLACFHFWPTAVPAHVIDPALYPGFGLIQGIDAAGNACPSLHVATAAFSAIWLDRLLREIGAGPAVRTINWTWFVLIAWSTMAIKQHVALDVLAGLLLGTLFALASLRNRYHTQQG
ncbi:MAG TPA: phosphatase PAP2 family protein [Rhodocyclaceae bacterium]|nr:phosphatase PAP2 family protein [Rhodocyclaceae bacterium]